MTSGAFRQHRQKLLAFDLKPMRDHAQNELSETLGFAMLWIVVDFQIDSSRPH